MFQLARFTALLCLALALALPRLALAQTPLTKWYLAEGATGFFEEEILIANPGATSAEVTITYLLPTGDPVIRNITVGATSRTTVRVNDVIAASAVSAVVESTTPIIVERSMYWGGAARLGGHNTTGVLQPAMEWHLAEGVSNAIFDTFLLVANPNDVDVSIEVSYLGDDGIKDVDNHTVRAKSRFNIWVRWDLDARFGGRFRNRAFATTVKSLTPNGPIIVERAVYWGGIFAAGLNPGGTNAAGTVQPSRTWHFAEGYTQGRRANAFLTFLLLANPNDTPAEVTTTFLLEDGTTEFDQRRIPANSRANIWVNEELRRASDAPFSIVVTTTHPGGIVAERAMYWGGLREGHVVTGIAEAARRWGFAEGIEDRHRGIDYDSYFLLANANSTMANVKATFYFEDGTGFVDNFAINPTSRYTLIAARYPQLSNRRFAAFFESDQPLVAERAVYWGPGYYGGHASAGVPLPDSVVVNAPQAIAPIVVSSISPAFGPTTGGTEVTIKGARFGMGATVTIGGIVAQRAVIDAETIVARTPPHTTGAKPVVVSWLGATATSPQDFTYEAPPPPPPPPPPASPTIARGAPAAIYCNGFAANGVCTSVVTPALGRIVHGVDAFGIISQLARERFDLLRSSCTDFNGQRIPGGNHEFMYEAVRRLRAATGSNRWGLNWKRGNVGDLSHDIVTYFYGPEGTEMQNDVRIYIIDIIANHCGPEAGTGNPGPNWDDVTEATRRGGAIGRWTTAGQNLEPR